MQPVPSGGAGRRGDPVVRVLVRALDARLRRVAPTVRRVGVEQASRRLAAVAEDFPERRLMVFYWLEDALPLMLAARLLEEPLPSEIAFIRDETIGGRITAGLLERAGRPTRRLSSWPPATRARDLQDLIREPASFGIAVDGHGPYRRVGRGFARLGLRCGAIAVPLAARVSRAWTIRFGATLHVPRRGTALALRIGDPIVCRGDEQTLQGAMQGALDENGAAADRSVRNGEARAATASV